MTKRRNTKATRAAIYREAARRQEKDQYSSCYAINEVVTGDPWVDTKEAAAYAAIFAPKKNPHPGAAWGLEWAPNDFVEVDNCRVVALCFMAAMVAAGDA